MKISKNVNHIKKIQNIKSIGNFFWKSATGNPEGLEETMWGFSLQLGGCCLLLIGTIILIIGSMKTKDTLLIELEWFIIIY